MSATTERAVLTRILRKYGFSYSTILPPEKGYRNQAFPIELSDGTLINLIIYKREQSILDLVHSANAVSDYLVENGLPCRKTMGNIMRLSSQHFVRYCAPYTYLPGHTIPWEAYTKDHIKQLGNTMSTMHATLEGFRMPTLNAVTDICLHINARMSTYFSDSFGQKALKDKLNVRLLPSIFNRFGKLLTACQYLPKQQILHMDFVRGNILFEDIRDAAAQLDVSISGILDFEKTSYGHPAFDIARTLAFLLVDCKYTPEAKIRKYFLISGYNKRGKGRFQNPIIVIAASRLNTLEGLIDFFLVHDFYKFLRHNPYESLEQNEHFVRTRTLLLQRGLIRKMV